MTNINSKADGWNAVGGDYWRLGKENSKPSHFEIERFLDRVSKSTRVAVVGASTIDVIRAAAARARSVHVFDFSTAMLHDAKLELDGADGEILFSHWDVTLPPDDQFLATFDLLISDRLLNRFSERELDLSLKHLLSIVSISGEMRMSIRLGLYDRDIALIQKAESLGKERQFYDSENKSIDFSVAVQLFPDELLGNGAINKETMIEWYIARGIEKRWEQEEFLAYFCASFGSIAYLVGIEEFDRAPNTFLFNFSKSESTMIKDEKCS